MHIPDGYLSPKTCVAFYAVMLPVWYLASKRAEKTLKLKQLPLLSLGAAFTFVVMMFNIPIPGGSSGHMVGACVVSIVLGPWAAVVALSLALALQALFFGDGGLTTLAANCFNMALLMSFSSYYVYRTLSFGRAGNARRVLASVIAAYVAVNIAALAVALELGIQPTIAHGAAGRPLYAPYPLTVTIPAMMFAHLLFFGPVEALGTALAVSYVHRTDTELLARGEGGGGIKPLSVILIIMIILTPLGLIASGTPWGEWSKAELKSFIGYVPEGMERLNSAWKGFIPGYGAQEKVFGGRISGAAAYLISAAAGSALVVFAVYIWGRLWRRR